MPPQFALHVFSRPSAASSSLWEEWYTTEHIPDMVHSGASTRASFYKALPERSATKDPKKQFVALYQTEYKFCLDTDNYRDNVRSKSDLFDDKNKDCHDYGKFDPRNYELLQCYDPKGVGEGPAPYILRVEINPQNHTASPDAAADELDKWYLEEHLELISKVPGWRRSLRYRLTKVEAPGEQDAATFVAIHEYDTLDHTQGPEAQTMRGTDWAKRMTGNAEVFKVIAFEKISSVGF